MKKFVFAATALSVALAAVPAAQAGTSLYCSSQSFSTTAPTGDGVGCQAAISKNINKFAKSAVKTRGKCLTKQDPTACPNAKDDAKIAKAALKAADGIVKKCSPSALAGLSNSYAAFTDVTDIGTCATSQVSALANIFLGLTHGTPGVLNTDDARDGCAKTLAKESVKLQASLHKTIGKCVDGAHKKGLEATDCSVATDGTGLVAPTDVKTAGKLQKAIDKATSKIEGACDALTTAQIESMFACPGATTAADLVACAVCSSAEYSFEFLDAAYNETGTIVTAAGGLQNAVDAASAGDKLLLLPGTYEEEVLLPAGVCVGGSEDGKGPRMLSNR